MAIVVIVWGHPLLDNPKVRPASGSDPLGAVSFCEQALASGKSLALIFFYGAGIKQLSTVTSPRLAKRWQKLSVHYPLKICSQAQRVYPTQLAFAIPSAGLGECFGACREAEQTIIFPPGPQETPIAPTHSSDEGFLKERTVILPKCKREFTSRVAYKQKRSFRSLQRERLIKRYLAIFTLGPEHLQTLQEGLDALLVAAGFYDVNHALFIHEAQWLISQPASHFSPEVIKLHSQFRALPLYDITIYITQPNPAITIPETCQLSLETTLTFIKQHDCIWTC